MLIDDLSEPSIKTNEEGNIESKLEEVIEKPTSTTSKLTLPTVAESKSKTLNSFKLPPPIKRF
jgi:hypothetical protein